MPMFSALKLDKWHRLLDNDDVSVGLQVATVSDAAILEPQRIVASGSRVQVPRTL